jgi:hypothetical protein
VDLRASWLGELKKYQVASHVNLITGASGTPAYASLPVIRAKCPANLILLDMIILIILEE